MDAACAIGGSGLAFGYYFLNAISDGSVQIGLSKEKSVRIVAHLLDASVECLNRADDPDKLFEYFTKGTPALVGLDHLRKLNIASSIENAVQASFNRINELASQETPPAFESTSS